MSRNAWVIIAIAAAAIITTCVCLVIGGIAYFGISTSSSSSSSNRSTPEAVVEEALWAAARGDRESVFSYVKEPVGYGAAEDLLFFCPSIDTTPISYQTEFNGDALATVIASTRAGETVFALEKDGNSWYITDVGDLAFVGVCP